MAIRSSKQSRVRPLDFWLNLFRRNLLVDSQNQNNVDLTNDEEEIIERIPLSPVQKIRFMQRKIKLYRYLKTLRPEK
jgi:hypothetical protein